MLCDFDHDKKIINLLPSNLNNFYSNVFTIIVGPNGIGKSRLLAAIAVERRRSIKFQREFFSDSDFSKIIAVSTSPFDKFSMQPRQNPSENIDERYCYIGMKGRGLGAPSAVSLISSATKGLLYNHINSRKNHRLVDAFNLLGFSPNIEIILKITSYFPIDQNDGKSSEATFIPSHVNDELPSSNNWDSKKARLALKFVSRFSDLNGNFSIRLSLDNGTINFKIDNESEDVDEDLIRHLLILMDLNVLRFMDLRLNKHEYGEMSLRRASSGEQCVIVSMIGIAGNIVDGSLVLIDEPEISLHPEWQEKYVKLLTSIFSDYKRCQFIIATHSPQIVANLPEKNCFVLSLLSNSLRPSKDFRNRSSDYQLAKLFRAPGARNEYLGRVALSLFVKIGKNKIFSSSDLEIFDELNDMMPFLEQEDPVFELINSLKGMKNHYGHD